MPLFFSSNNNQHSPIGRTVAYPYPGVSGITRIAGDNAGESDYINWNAHRSIVTRVAMSHACNFQASHMIGNDVYLYVFGDKLGQVIISGLSMAVDCGCYPGGSGYSMQADGHGIEKAYQWYLRYRVTQERKPVTVTIGSTTHFQGILINMDTDTHSEENFLMRYTMTVQTIPEKK